MSDEIDESKVGTGLAQATIQLFAWLSLFGMFVVDKVMHLVAPPLPEYWYGAAFAVAAFGKAASVFFNRK